MCVTQARLYSLCAVEVACVIGLRNFYNENREEGRGIIKLLTWERESCQSDLSIISLPVKVNKLKINERKRERERDSKRITIRGAIVVFLINIQSNNIFITRTRLWLVTTDRNDFSDRGHSLSHANAITVRATISRNNERNSRTRGISPAGLLLFFSPFFFLPFEDSKYISSSSHFGPSSSYDNHVLS